MRTRQRTPAYFLLKRLGGDEVTDEKANKSPKASWTKRYQMSLAILGAVLTLATYFGKDHAQEHWRTLATNIKAAEANVEASQTSSRLDRRLERLSSDLQLLSDDAMSFEKNEKPHAQLDRFDSTREASAASRNSELVIRFSSFQQHLASLAALNEATDARSPLTSRLQQLRSEVDQELSDTHKAEFRHLANSVALLGYKLFPVDPAQLSAENTALERREEHADKVEDRIEELASAIRTQADAQRDRYMRYSDRSTVILSVIFVLGLLLSLIGKVSIGE